MSKKSGIYLIKNIATNKYYVGKSVNIYNRWTIHKSTLRWGTHGNKYLLRAWEKYGEQSFIFEILEECKPEKLNEREIYYVQFYNSYEDGYNLTIGGEEGWEQSDKSKQKMSEFTKEFRNSYANKCLTCNEDTKTGWHKYCSLHKYECHRCGNRTTRRFVCEECLIKKKLKKEKANIKPAFYCSICKKEIEKIKNNQKYCKECAIIVKREQQKLLMRQKRLKRDV